MYGQKTRKGEKIVQSLINTKENKNKSGKHLFTNSMKERIVAEGCERWLLCGSRMGPEGLHGKKRGEEKLFTLANGRKHTKLVLLFQDVLSKDV